MERLKASREKLLNIEYVQILREIWGIDDWIALFILVVGILKIFQDIYVELIGIGVSALILGNTAQCLRIKAEKKRLILQMSSPDNSDSIKAARQLAYRGWLYDGTTKKADLKGAHLEGADLRDAHLEGADLRDAHLNGANLSGACLEGAHLGWENPEGLLLLGRAVLQDPHRLSQVGWRGDLQETFRHRGAHLEGADLRDAHLEGANLCGAFLEGAHLGWVHLEGAFLKWASYNDCTNWVDVKFTEGDNGTVWPDEDFDPGAKGCILVGECPI